MIKVGLVSDTHAPRFWKSLPERVAAALDGVDLILHAGDVCVPEVLDELSGIAPVTVVLGNNDGAEVAAWGAPETQELTLEGLRVAMIHDSGAAQGRGARMRRRFPAADLVVFGHSHIPYDEVHRDTTGRELRLVNPGSPTDRRRQPHRTLGLLTIDTGRLLAADLVTLD